MRLKIVLAAAALWAGTAAAAPKDWVEAHKPALLAEYTELLALPNVATNRADILRNAQAIVAMMARRGLKPRMLEDGDAPPLIYGEWAVPGATRTYIVYAHYDGQAVSPEDWKITPPFTPRLVGEGAEARLYARSASDDKAGVMAILAAVEALKADGKKPAYNVKIVFEGEEEQGSPHLAALLDRHKATLASDGWVIVDGPAHQSGAQQLTLGVRGDVNAELTVYGPARPLHSGHYGNWAPNPAMMLARLLASMKDESGRVTITGWYDDVVPLTPAERQAIAAVPPPDAALKQELGLGWTEGGGAGLTELIQLPSLNVNGIRSADVGDKARNVIPTVATATLDLRLVLGNDPARQVAKLAAHISAQGYEVLDHAPSMAERLAHPRVATLVAEPGYPAERTRIEDALPRSLIAALKARGPLVVLPSLGGSLPLYVIRQKLGAPTVVLGLWNYDNNQHAEDENVRLANLWNGIEAIAAILTMP
jgi:acetylornithine deacetylase/succinyl-diaminopimelate desuccinylase-like protein